MSAKRPRICTINTSTGNGQGIYTSRPPLFIHSVHTRDNAPSTKGKKNSRIRSLNQTSKVVIKGDRLPLSDVQPHPSDVQMQRPIVRKFAPSHATATVSWHNRQVEMGYPLIAKTALPETLQKLANYVWPTRGILTSGYGYWWGDMHKGVKIATAIATPVIATADGVVDDAGWNSRGYGHVIQLWHLDGSRTRYAHNHRLFVKAGQSVSQGQVIAEVGCTGYCTAPHLHFAIRQPDAGNGTAKRIF